MFFHIVLHSLYIHILYHVAFLRLVHASVFVIGYMEDKFDRGRNFNLHADI